MVEPIWSITFYLLCCRQENDWKLNCCIKGPDSRVLLYVLGPTNVIPRKKTNAAILEIPAKAKEQKGSRRHETYQQKHSGHSREQREKFRIQHLFGLFRAMGVSNVPQT